MALETATAVALPPQQAPVRSAVEARLINRLGQRRYHALLVALAAKLDDVTHAGPIDVHVERHHGHGGVVLVGKVLVTSAEVIAS